jgi:hypothetical protein
MLLVVFTNQSRTAHRIILGFTLDSTNISPPYTYGMTILFCLRCVLAVETFRNSYSLPELFLLVALLIPSNPTRGEISLAFPAAYPCKLYPIFSTLIFHSTTFQLLILDKAFWTTGN